MDISTRLLVNLSVPLGQQFPECNLSQALETTKNNTTMWLAISTASTMLLSRDDRVQMCTGRNYNARSNFHVLDILRPVTDKSHGMNANEIDVQPTTLASLSRNFKYSKHSSPRADIVEHDLHPQPRSYQYPGDRGSVLGDHRPT